MRAWQCFASCIGLFVAVPLLLTVGYLVWGTSPFTAFMVVMVGIAGLVLEGARVLNRAVTSV